MAAGRKAKVRQAPRKAVKRRNHVAAARSTRPAISSTARCHGVLEARRMPRRGGEMSGSGQEEAAAERLALDRRLIVVGRHAEEAMQECVVALVVRRWPSERVAVAGRAGG